MKLGIITMHSVIHHGSVLQAYATQRFFEKKGYDVEIIDYQYPNVWHEEHGLNVFKPNLKTKIARVLGLKPYYRGRKKIIQFQKKYYKLSKHYDTPKSIKEQPPEYNIYLSGSDQIWNPKFTCGDTVYMLDFVKDKKKRISLSSSFACQNLPDKYKDQYRKFLSRYLFLSVRENQGVNIMRSLLGREVEVTLDPTLLLDRKEWESFVYKYDSKRPFIYLYMLDYAYNPKPYIYELTKYFSEKLGLIVKSNVKIPSEFNTCYEDVSDAGIEDFLSNICNASLVITSSFHGTAFAVNFGTPLLAVVPEKNTDDRLSSLLQNLQLDNCIVSVNTDFNRINPYYNREEQQERLDKLRLTTFKFVNKAIEDEKR